VQSRRSVARNFERSDKRYTTKNTCKVVGASDSNSLEIAELFYQQTIEKVVTVSSAKAAELVKVFENTFRAVNIALVNELALLCDRLDLNVWEVLDAANTKPFGIMPFCNIDYVGLVSQAKAVLDTRGVTRKLNCNQLIKKVEKVTL
jgi:UDP-N-acetyl-D-mannosaminuronate dehydrogenase